MDSDSEPEVGKDDNNGLSRLRRRFNGERCDYSLVDIKDSIPKEVKKLLKNPCTCKFSEGRVRCGEDCEYRGYLIECAGHECENQEVTRGGIVDKLEIFHTAQMGIGVRTTVGIAKGGFVLPYIGEIITEDVYKERLKTTDMSYGVRLLGCKRNLICDPLFYGNIGRYLNHKCSANLNMYISYIGGKPVPTLWAKRDIGVGEELFFNYQFENYGEKEFECCCGSDNCIEKRDKRAKSVNVPARRKEPRKEEKPFRCVICPNAGFRLNKDLKQHYLKVHKIGNSWTMTEAQMKLQTCLKVSCRKYNTTFRRPSWFERHLESHSSRKREKCSHCDTLLKNVTTLKEHIRNVHGVEP